MAQTTLDIQWFERLLPHTKELFESLGAPHQIIATYRQQFESQPFNPDLRPVDIDVNNYRRLNDELRALKAEIEASESHPAVRQAYRLRIDEILIQNDLLVASANNDSAAFAEADRILYGQPDPQTFASVCDWLRQIAGDSFASSIPLLAEAANAVLQCIPDLHGNIRHIIPNDQIFKAVRDAHFEPGGFIDHLFAGCTIPDHITVKDADEITRAAIRNVGSVYELQDSTDELWGVIHGRKAVVRPLDLELSKPDFMGIVAHEVGSHLLERENGYRQPLRLLSVGLDRYENSNEGRALLREQIMYNSTDQMLSKASWEHIVLLYVSAALGTGIYRQPYDFQSMYATMYPVCLLFQSRRQPDNPVYAERRAKDEAWNLCVRAAKGTDGNGGAYSKALVYLQGNLAAWQLAEENIGNVFYGDNGKFDIARQDHCQILAGCGINLPPTARL